jgi:hypothetical protein
MIGTTAVADPANVLDTAVITGQDFAIDSVAGKPFTQQFSNNGANFTDCEATPDGIFCIDSGTYIVDLASWDPTDETTAAATALTTCTDIGFQPPKRNQTEGNCSAVTFDDALYIAGVRNKNGSAIYRCDDSGCDLLIQERPTILDLDSVPGGLLYIEDKNSIVQLVLDSGGAPTAVTLATGRDLDLVNSGKVKEEFQNVQRIVYGDDVEAYVVTTSFGRLIAFTSAAGVVTILDDEALAESAEGLIPILDDVDGCGAAAPGYDVAQNADRGGLLYVSASDTCYVHALDIDLASGFDLTHVASVETTVVDAGEPTAVAYNGLTVHVYEGQNIIFSQCGDEPCPVGNFATLSFTRAEGSAENGTVWEIELIPHCAWGAVQEVCVGLYEEQFELPIECGDGDAQACLCEVGVLQSVNDPLDSALCAGEPPGLLTFNVTPLLPQNLLAEFDPAYLPDGTFPKLWMGPEFQAQPVNGYYFDALLYDAPLAQSSVNPELVVADIPGSYKCPAESSAGNVDSPLQSSMVLRAAEREQNGFTCDADDGCTLTGQEHKASAITYNCSSTRSRKGCCSLYPLNTMLALRPPAKDRDGNWYVDESGVDEIRAGIRDPEIAEDPIPTFVDVDDSAAAKFVDSHFDQLDEFEYPACSDFDTDNNAQPLDTATCEQLEAKRLNAKAKLVNALSNTATGNNCSQPSRNYQSFVTQIENYIVIAQPEGDCNDGIDNDGDGLTDDCVNPANDPLGRVQSLIAHASVLPYAVKEILGPTIPQACATGWDEDAALINDDGTLTWITD